MQQYYPNQPAYNPYAQYPQYTAPMGAGYYPVQPGYGQYPMAPGGMQYPAAPMGSGANYPYTAPQETNGQAPSIPQSETVSEEPVKEEKPVDLGINLGFFSSDAAKKIPVSTGSVALAEKKAARKPRTKTINGEEVVLAQEDVANVPVYQSNEPYLNTYDEANNLLRSSIAQADQLGVELKQDIDEIRKSKTLKSKYTYLTNLTSSEASLISTKISAIKELSNIVTQAHNLDIKRIKDLKLDAAKEKVNDDKSIMDMYSAFINTPIGSYTPTGGSAGPTMQDLTAGINQFTSMDIVPVGGGNAFPATGPMSPEQARMRVETNSNIETVVRFDQGTGQRFFDVIDKITGASMPGVSKPDAFLLEDTHLDIRNGIAKNRNIGATWPLVLIGNSVVAEY